MLPTLRFSRELGLVFCGVVGCLFLELCQREHRANSVLVYLQIVTQGIYGRLVSIEICLFFGLFFHRFLFCGLLFFIFYGTFAVLIYCLRHIGRVFMKIFSFSASCFFWFASLLVYLIFLLIFHFAEFSCQCMLGLFYGLITNFWLVFQIYLLVFAK